MVESNKISRFSYVGDFLKYFAASFIALFVDYATYWLIVQSNIMGLTGAASFGYATGLIVAYFLIRKNVFSNGWLKERPAYEILLFGLSGALGIILTYSSVALYVMVLSENVHGAKLFAIAVSFVAVWFFRKKIVFKEAEKERGNCL